MLGFSETFKSFPGVLPASAITRRCSRQGPLDSDAEILTVDVVPTWEAVREQWLRCCDGVVGIESGKFIISNQFQDGKQSTVANASLPRRSQEFDTVQCAICISSVHLTILSRVECFHLLDKCQPAASG